MPDRAAVSRKASVDGWVLLDNTDRTPAIIEPGGDLDLR